MQVPAAMITGSVDMMESREMHIITISFKNFHINCSLGDTLPPLEKNAYVGKPPESVSVGSYKQMTGCQ